MTDLQTRIGQRVRLLRKTVGLTQKQVAAATGLTRPRITAIEQGAAGGLNTMLALAELFVVPLDYLLCREVPPGGPLQTRVVYRPDEVEILDFWHSLSFDQKKALVRSLALPVPAIAEDLKPAQPVAQPARPRRRHRVTSPNLSP